MCVECGVVTYSRFATSEFKNSRPFCGVNVNWCSLFFTVSDVSVSVFVASAFSSGMTSKRPDDAALASVGWWFWSTIVCG